MAKSELTEKQKRFCDEYLIDLNATQAYIRAGYSPRNDAVAYANGARLLGYAKVQSYIQVRLAEKDAARVATQDEILEFLTSVLRGELQEETPIGTGGGAQVLKLKGSSIKDRLRAAELLAKRYGLLDDRQQDSHSDGLRMEVMDEYGEGREDDSEME